MRVVGCTKQEEEGGTAMNKQIVHRRPTHTGVVNGAEWSAHGRRTP